MSGAQIYLRTWGLRIGLDRAVVLTCLVAMALYPLAVSLLDVIGIADSPMCTWQEEEACRRVWLPVLELQRVFLGAVRGYRQRARHRLPKEDDPQGPPLPLSQPWATAEIGALSGPQPVASLELQKGAQQDGGGTATEST